MDASLASDSATAPSRRRCAYLRGALHLPIPFDRLTPTPVASSPDARGIRPSDLPDVLGSGTCPTPLPRLTPLRWLGNAGRLIGRAYRRDGRGSPIEATQRAGRVQTPDHQRRVHPLNFSCHFLTSLTGGVECLHLPQASAGFVNRFLAQFVTSVAAQPETLAQAAADAESLPKKLAEHLKPALIRMADWTEQTNPDTAKAMRKREPKSIFSFSRTPAEGVAGMEAL